MDKRIVLAWEKNKSEIRRWLTNNHPVDYAQLVKVVVEHVGGSVGMDHKRIHEIDDGDYQGTLVFVIAEKGYQPSRYWYVMVDYGSCSGCDTLESIRRYGDAPPTGRQVDDYMTLALHVVQGIKSMQ